jgi:hypothetical protein
MSRRLKLHWIFLALLAAILTSGAIAYSVSSKPQAIPLSLTPQTSAHLSVFRLLGSNLHLSLEFERRDGQRLADLGESAYLSAERAAGVLVFPNPGLPIKLKVVAGGESIIVEALPAGTYGSRIGRDLVVAQDGGFRVPFVQLGIPAGTTDVQVTVEEVGGSLVGEQVSLTVHPPLSFKAVSPGFEWLWWFWLWPVFVAGLVFYATVLIWRTAFSRRKKDLQ